MRVIAPHAVGLRAAGRAALIALVLLLVGAGAPAAVHGAGAKKRPSAKSAAPAATAPHLEDKAIAILKAASDRLAAAHTLRFTAVVSYENPSVYGTPLLYTTSSDVVVERPDKLRIITSGDGPASAFYYDGKTMVAYAPAENLVAVAAAPPTIDAALRVAYDSAATYFPFTDLIVSDPYKDIADSLQLAFYIGQSKVVGGTTTDMVAYATSDVFVQTWIGAEDKLPRMVRAVYAGDPKHLRHQMELSNWQLDLHVPADAFETAEIVASAKHIEFERPDPPRVAAAAEGQEGKGRRPKQ
jgi:hypothetical protein